MHFINELLMVISFCISVIFTIISLSLTIIVKSSGILSGPLIIIFMIALFGFIIISPLSFFYFRDTQYKFPVSVLLLLLIISIIVVGGILIKQSLDALKSANAEEETMVIQTRMEDVVHIETKEFKITIGAGAIGLAGAILYGIAKILEVTKSQLNSGGQLQGGYSVTASTLPTERL